MPRIELERVEEVDETEERSTESFDRIAFAEQALALVALERVTVAICAGTRRVSVDGGRQWGKPEGHRWAVLSVPVDASRRAIARAVLELTPFGTPRPWALELLVMPTPYRGER
ncbi:MAG: hypothetical protein JWP97_533 [Labilithrix sp.]|nr:hypothetical protein [Labilithrix sp.]